MQLQSGTLLQGGKYKIIHHLGQGSFGITYLAEHTALGKRVCIKEFFMKELNLRSEDGSITGLSDGTLSYNYAKKFRKEAMNLASMEHPNIVRVTDSFDENGTFYYVMDYIEGKNLNEYIKDNVLSESEAISIIKDVANALMYMHEQKHMLHLDLKPGNIMRRASDGHIFLIDFGLSKHYDKNGTPETSTTIGGGTPGYAPIEQGDKAKDGEFRPTIDVYALGATLFKLLTRETPPTASEVVNDDEILAEKLSNNGVSQGIIDLVVKAMMPGSKKRIQTMREFISTLSGSTESFNSKQNHHTSPVDSEETIVTNSTNTPANAKGFRENVYGNGQKKETISGSTESFNSGRNYHTSPVDSEETIVTNSTNTPPNAKGFRENVYGNVSQKNETASPVDSEETIVTNSSNTPPNAKGFREDVYGNGSQKKETIINGGGKDYKASEKNNIDDDSKSFVQNMNPEDILRLKSLLQKGNYQIVRHLSSGGFGNTYEAIDTIRQARVAIKEFYIRDLNRRDRQTNNVILSSQSHREIVDRFRQMFIEEAKVGYQMKHDHIIPVIDIFEENNTVYYAMEYIDGRDLSDIVRAQGPLTESKALHIINQVADALKYMHSQNRFHLNVKPSNIIINSTGKVFLSVSGAKYEGVFTKGYSPVEHVNQNNSSFSPATDIYALGATLYKLLTGVTPPWIDELMYGEIDFSTSPFEISASTKNAIIEAMRPRSKDRPQSIDEFLALLNRDVRTGTQKKNSEKAAVANGSVNHIEMSDNESNGNFITKYLSEKWTLLTHNVYSAFFYLIVFLVLFAFWIYTDGLFPAFCGAAIFVGALARILGGVTKFFDEYLGFVKVSFFVYRFLCVAGISSLVIFLVLAYSLGW